MDFLIAKSKHDNLVKLYKATYEFIEIKKSMGYDIETETVFAEEIFEEIQVINKLKFN